MKAKEAAKERIQDRRIDIREVRETETRAKQWLDANGKLEETAWTHYYLYALERCMAFRERFRAQRSEKEPNGTTTAPSS